MDLGYFKLAAATARTSVADPEKNVSAMLGAYKKALDRGVQLMVYPELCLTGYTCGDLFYQRQLLDCSQNALKHFLEQTADSQMALVVGLPVLLNSMLFNCAAVAQGGKLLGVVPKLFLPNTHEFNEKRWFRSGLESQYDQVTLAGQTVPFGSMLFDFGRAKLGVEICEDLWSPIPPSCDLALLGANIIVNPSASNELVTKLAYRDSLVGQQSARLMCAYAYASAGPTESTTDLVFSGHCFVYENGRKLADGQRFSREGAVVSATIDLLDLENQRQSSSSFADSVGKVYRNIPVIKGIPAPYDYQRFDRVIDPSPFIPKDAATKEAHFEDITTIQALGLAKRLEHTGLKKAVIGVSGGLDSTLALLVTCAAFDALSLPRRDIIAMTLPGFGTTARTLASAEGLMAALGTTSRRVDITRACLAHFQDIGHDKVVHDVTYENVQARERTQILMDVANREGGLLVGTGDMSELALGWCTYNGDHMSMYGVNASVPKTLVFYLVDYYGRKYGGQIQALLEGVLDTPISPELLPPGPQDQINQMTEQLVGPYALHDFFLYHLLKFGTPPDKLLFMAKLAFSEKYSHDELKKWLKLFYRRFFSQQFKRSCVPDGPKVGSVGLSPRGDWRMPSDALSDAWLKEL